MIYHCIIISSLSIIICTYIYQFFIFILLIVIIVKLYIQSYAVVTIHHKRIIISLSEPIMYYNCYLNTFLNFYLSVVSLVMLPAPDGVYTIKQKKKT